MVIQCENCQAKFRLDDSKIGEKGAKVKCTKCATVFRVMPGGAPPPPAPIDGGLGISFDEGDGPSEGVSAPASTDSGIPPMPPKAAAPPVAPPVEESPPEEAPAEEAPSVIPPPVVTPPVESPPTEAPAEDTSGFFSGDDGSLAVGGDIADSDDFSGEAPGVDGGIDFGTTEEAPPAPESGVPENTEGDGGYYDANADFVDSSESTDYAIDFGTESSDDSDDSEDVSFGFDAPSDAPSDEEEQNETVVFSIGNDGESSESEEEKTVFGYTPPEGGEDETMQAGADDLSLGGGGTGLGEFDDDIGADDAGAIGFDSAADTAIADSDDDGDIIFTGPPVKAKKGDKQEEPKDDSSVSGADVGAGMGEDFEAEPEGVGESAFKLPSGVFKDKKTPKKSRMPSFDFDRFKKPIMTLLILGIVGGGGYYTYPMYEPYLTEATKDIDIPSLEELGMPDLHTDDMIEAVDVFVGDIIEILPPEVLDVMGKSPVVASGLIVELSGVSGAFKENTKLGMVLVLKGTIKNKSKVPLSLKEARGILYNNRGKVIAANTTEPGRVLTADAIKNSSEAEFFNALGRNSTAKVPADSTMPVVVVFTDLPEGLSKASIEISY